MSTFPVSISTYSLEPEWICSGVEALAFGLDSSAFSSPEKTDVPSVTGFQSNQRA